MFLSLAVLFVCLLFWELGVSDALSEIPVPTEFMGGFVLIHLALDQALIFWWVHPRDLSLSVDRKFGG